MAIVSLWPQEHGHKENYKLVYQSLTRPGVTIVSESRLACHCARSLYGLHVGALLVQSFMLHRHCTPPPSLTRLLTRCLLTLADTQAWGSCHRQWPVRALLDSFCSPVLVRHNPMPHDLGSVSGCRSMDLETRGVPHGGIWVGIDAKQTRNCREVSPIT